MGTLNFWRLLKFKSKKIKFYQASTSEMFGNINKETITEKDSFNPVSPYGTSKLYSYWILKNYRDHTIFCFERYSIQSPKVL